MSNISKSNFIKKLNDSYIKIDHLSDRRLDYKYLEYRLFNILIKYKDEYDFSVLGLPDNLVICSLLTEGDYDISKMTHVTLNAELFRIYDIGYFTEIEFIDYVIITISRYKEGSATIKDLVYETRKIRLDYEKMIKDKELVWQKLIKYQNLYKLKIYCNISLIH